MPENTKTIEETTVKGDPELAVGVKRWEIPVGTLAWNAAPNTSRYPQEFPQFEKPANFVTNTAAKVVRNDGIWFFGQVESPPDMRANHPLPCWVVWDQHKKEWKTGKETL